MDNALTAKRRERVLWVESARHGESRMPLVQGGRGHEGLLGIDDGEWRFAKASTLPILPLIRVPQNLKVSCAASRRSPC